MLELKSHLLFGKKGKLCPPGHGWQPTDKMCKFHFRYCLPNKSINPTVGYDPSIIINMCLEKFSKDFEKNNKVPCMTSVGCHSGDWGHTHRENKVS